MHEKFLTLNPPKYSGSVEPTEDDIWVRDLETIFAVMKVPDIQKVNIVVFKLKGEAKYWWEASNHLVPRMEGSDVITWAEFIKALYVKYFPKVYRREKLREFINLTQRKMSVREYDAKFTALSRFATKYVQNEGDKCSKFQDGLIWPIQNRVATYELEDYASLLNKSMIAERQKNQGVASRESFKKSRFDAF